MPTHKQATEFQKVNYHLGNQLQTSTLLPLKSGQQKLRVQDA